MLGNMLAGKVMVRAGYGNKKGKRIERAGNLGFKLHDVINSKEQTVLESIKYSFEGENMQAQYSLLRYKIDCYFLEYKLAIEVDELSHIDGNITMKNKDKK